MWMCEQSALAYDLFIFFFSIFPIFVIYSIELNIDVSFIFTYRIFIVFYDSIYCIQLKVIL